MAISIAKLAIHLTTETGGMIAGFGKAKSLVSGFASSMGGSGSFLSGGVWGVAIAGATALTAAVAATVYEGIRVNAQIEKMTASMGAMIGSTEEAKRILADMRAFDKASPLNFEELAAGARTLLTVGASVEEINGLMFMLGEMSAASGKPVSELAVLYGQVRSAGRLMTQDLNQFTAAGIPLQQQLQQQFGVTGAELRKMIEAGLVSYADVNQALTDMTTGAGRLAGQGAAAADTLSGKWDKLKATSSELASTALIAFEPMLKQLIDMATRFLELLISAATAIGRFSGVEMPKTGAELTQGEREAEIRAVNDLIAAKQKEADAAKAIADEQKRVADEAAKRMEDMKRKADSLTQSLRTPGEVWRDSMTEINALMQEGLINWDTYTRAIEQATQKLDEQSQAKNGLDRASSNPALLQGTQAFITATRGGQTNIEKLHTEAQKQTALQKHAEQQRKEMIAAMKDNRPANIIPINF